MRSTHSRLAVLGLLVVGGVGGVLLGAPDVITAPPPGSVIVVNGPDKPVPTTVTGTPTVSVAGTVTVQPAREPFQQFVAGTSDGSEVCDPLSVPAGRRLTLESLSVDGEGSVEPHVYIRVSAVGGSVNSVRPVHVDLRPVVSGFAGVADVLLHSGTPSPGVHTYTLEVCVKPGPGASLGLYRAFASGWLEDA